MKKLVNLKNRTVKEWDSIALPGKAEYTITIYDRKIEGNRSVPHFEHRLTVAYDNGDLYATNIYKNYVKGFHTVSKKEVNYCDLPNKYQKAVTDLFVHIDKEGGTIFGGYFRTVLNKAKIDSVFVSPTGVVLIDITLFIG